MMKLINMLFLIMITLGIMLPKEIYISGIVDSAEAISITDVENKSSDDTSDDNDDFQKADAVEPYFILNRYDFSLNITAISFLERLPDFTSSYIPDFHVPPSP